MASKARVGAGTQLYIGEALLVGGLPLPANDDFVPIGEVLTIGGPNVQKTEVDVTPLDSLAMEYKSGRRNSGNLELTMNMIPDDAGQIIIQSDVQNDDTQRNFRIIGPGSSPALQVDFRAEVMTYGLNFEGGAAFGATVSCKVSGELTFS